MAELNGAQVQADGNITCPRCARKVNCGQGGLTNLVTQHWASKGCKDIARLKASTQPISSFFARVSKTKAIPTPIPSRAQAPLRIQAGPPSSTIPKPSTRLSAPPAEGMPSLDPGKQHAHDLLRALRAAIDRLPDSAEAWEVLDPALNRLFGYGATVESVASIVRRGDSGMLGVHRIIKAFVDDYEGIGGALLEGKMATTQMRGLCGPRCRRADDLDSRSKPTTVVSSPRRCSRRNRRGHMHWFQRAACY